MSGCARLVEIPDFVPSASRQAVVRWQVNASATTFDAVIARSAAGAAALDLYKGSPAPVLSVRLAPDGRASVKGPAAKRSWSGERSAAPPEIDLLLALVALFSNEESLPSGTRELHAHNMRVAFTKIGRELVVASARSADLPSVITLDFRKPPTQ
jgi:hypothetical protein